MSTCLANCQLVQLEAAACTCLTRYTDRSPDTRTRQAAASRIGSEKYLQAWMHRGAFIETETKTISLCTYVPIYDLGPRIADDVRDTAGQ